MHLDPEVSARGARAMLGLTWETGPGSPP